MNQRPGTAGHHGRGPRREPARPTSRRVNPRSTSRDSTSEPGVIHRFFHEGRPGGQRGRLVITLAILLLSFAIFIGRAVYLQAIQAPKMAQRAADRMRYTHDLLPDRGAITDRNGSALARSESAVLVFVDPQMISRNGVDERAEMSRSQQAKAAAAPKAVAKILAKHLGGYPEDYREALTKKDKSGRLSRYSIVKHQVPSYTFDQIKAEMKDGGWYGVFSSNDPVRSYPSGTLAASLIGFVNTEGRGSAGLEYSLDKKLTGTKGKESYEASTYGRIPLGHETLIPATNGNSYTLTLDAQLQLSVQNALEAQMHASKAESGQAIVMDVKTGEVLAMASAPGFDPKDYGKAKANQLRNHAIADNYEPGSVQKVITMAALADQGIVDADTHVVVPRTLPSGGSHIKDAFDHDTLHLTARGVIAKSSNIGTTLLTRQTDKSTLTKYLQAFNLGKPTGIELPGEATGSIPPASMADYTRDQVSFGQGMSVTSIQEAAAVAAVVNGGGYHQPRILKSGVDGNGDPIEIPTGKAHRVISRRASSTVMDMMESVVTLAPDRQVPGYRTAGKTGTAERIDPSCHCYRGYTASYVTVGPVEDPRILTYVVINNPSKGSHQGSGIALPVGRQIMSVALPQFGVPPSRTKAPKKPLEYTP